MVSVYSVNTITTSSTLQFGYNVFYIDATSGNITATLPDISNEGSGLRILIKRLDNTSNTVTITGTVDSPPQTINGITSVNLSYNNICELESYNGVWQIVLNNYLNYNLTSVTNGDSPYTATITDDILAVDTSGGAVTITLPEISTLGTIGDLKAYTITDVGGSADVNNITVTRSGSDTIIGNTSVVINDSYNSITVYSNGTSAWFLR